MCPSPEWKKSRDRFSSDRVQDFPLTQNLYKSKGKSNGLNLVKCILGLRLSYSVVFVVMNRFPWTISPWTSCPWTELPWTAPMATLSMAIFHGNSAIAKITIHFLPWTHGPWRTSMAILTIEATSMMKCAIYI